MKEIRLKYHRDTGIRVNPEINLVHNYYDSGSDNWKFPFPNLYNYINWLEDQLENPIGIKAVNTAKAAKVGKKLQTALRRLL